MGRQRLDGLAGLQTALRQRTETDGVSALGESFAAARDLAYDGVKRISFPGMQWRPDIAERAVAAENGELELFPPGVLA